MTDYSLLTFFAIFCHELILKALIMSNLVPIFIDSTLFIKRDISVMTVVEFHSVSGKIQ